MPDDAQPRPLDIREERRRREAEDPAARRARGEAWLREHAEALRSYNEWVERNGLPLEHLRVW